MGSHSSRKTAGAGAKFLFKIPKVRSNLSSQAKMAIQIATLASGATRVERTFCEHPDGRPENDAEHSFMLSRVARELAAQFYPDLDANLVACLGQIHDDVEIYVGDTPTHISRNHDQSAKAALEAKGLRQLRREYANFPSYVKLLESYEAQEIPESVFVRAVDKLMVLLIHYPNQGVFVRERFTYESFIESERLQIEKDGHKYGQFTEIIELRRELGQELADRYLR